LGALDYVVKDVDGGYLRLLPSVIEQVIRSIAWRRTNDAQMKHCNSATVS